MAGVDRSCTTTCSAYNMVCEGNYSLWTTNTAVGMQAAYAATNPTQYGMVPTCKTYDYYGRYYPFIPGVADTSNPDIPCYYYSETPPGGWTCEGSMDIFRRICLCNTPVPPLPPPSMPPSPSLPPPTLWFIPIMTCLAFIIGIGLGLSVWATRKQNVAKIGQPLSCPKPTTLQI
jgi:hypothetical protein